MKTCIYCGKLKPDADFSSLEHLIPQFLGGGCVPNRFKTRDACTRCNNVLGLFVDGSFSRSWIVTNWLTFAGLAAYTPTSNVGPPLMFMGIARLEMPGIKAYEVCEGWLGPAGERVYLVRPADEQLYWYAGGNPITAKQVDTRAYFMFSEKSQDDPRRTLLAFRDSFRNEKVKKLTCTDVDGFDMATIGFSKPDELDLDRIKYLRSDNQKGNARSVSIPTNINFDYRFMCKLALGIGYAVVGERLINSDYCRELRKGIWFRDGDLEPKIRGTSLFSDSHLNNDGFRRFIGMRHAVTLSILALREGLTLTLALGTNHAWAILLAPREDVGDDVMREYGDGVTLVLYPFLNECIELTQAEFLSHKLGNSSHNKLSAIESYASTNSPEK